jgi:uncharacterized membrane protein YgdD (TMEM256/DUF423 family)
MGLRSWAALCAAVSIAAGAFGAHAASSPQAADWLKTGTMYLLPHAIAALFLAPLYARQAAVLLVGALVFALSLYALALGAPRWMGAVAPIGGGLMIAAWLSLAWQMWNKNGR